MIRNHVGGIDRVMF